MSTNQTPVLDEKAAYDRLYDEVHIPVFFAKLAEHGINPSTEAEKVALLRIGHNLLAVEQDNLTKQAAHRGSFLEGLAAELDQHLGAQPEALSYQLKVAADHYAGRADLLQAANALVA